MVNSVSSGWQNALSPSTRSLFINYVFPGDPCTNATLTDETGAFEISGVPALGSSCLWTIKPNTTVNQVLRGLSKAQWINTFVCGTIWNDAMSDNKRQFTIRYNVHCHLSHLSQSEDWIFRVSLATPTCNVWHYVLSRICRSMERSF